MILLLDAMAPALLLTVTLILIIAVIAGIAAAVYFIIKAILKKRK